MPRNNEESKESPLAPNHENKDLILAMFLKTRVINMHANMLGGCHTSEEALRVAIKKEDRVKCWRLLAGLSSKPWSADNAANQP